MKPAVCPINFRGLAVTGSIARVLPMSRRSRKRGNVGGVGWLGKAALGLILAGVLGAGVLYAMVRGYLHSDTFRRFLSEKVSAAAGVEGEFTPFRWDGLAVDTTAFEATGSGIVRGLKVEGLHTEVGVGAVGRGVWEIQGSQVQRLELRLDGRTSAQLVPPRAEKRVSRPAVRQKGWLPTEVELLGLDVREVGIGVLLDQGTAGVEGMKMRVERGGGKGAYRVELADGTIRLPFGLLPEFRLERAKLRWQDGQVFLNSAAAAAWKEGRFAASGEWDRASGRYSLEGDASDVKCGEVFNEDWSKRLTGHLASDFTLGNLEGAPVARGRLTIRDGSLTALPVLDALAAYADTRRFRVLALSEAQTDWRWKQGEILLTNLVIASEGLVRLEGNIIIRGRGLDGVFRLGLAPGTLASIPGAETDVFSAGERGLLWAPLRITGSLDDPKEDLTDRLIAAAGQRMFDIIPGSGEKVIKFTRAVLGESPASAVDQGVKLLDQGSKAVTEVSGILGGILGSGSPPETETSKDEPKNEP